MNKKAFSLIELVMMIVVIGVLAAGSGYMIIAVMDVWGFVSFRHEVVADARIALDRMVREIRITKDTDSISRWRSDQYRFTDVNNERINFRFRRGSIRRNGDILVDDVSAFSFTYYDADGNTASSADEIWTIVMELTVRKGSEEHTLIARVHPRNFSL